MLTGFFLTNQFILDIFDSNVNSVPTLSANQNWRQIRRVKKNRIDSVFVGLKRRNFERFNFKCEGFKSECAIVTKWHIMEGPRGSKIGKKVSCIIWVALTTILI